MRGRVKRQWDQTAPKRVKCHDGRLIVHLCAESAPVNRRPESGRCRPSKMSGLRLPPPDVGRPAPYLGCLGIQHGLQRTVRLNPCRRCRLIILPPVALRASVRRHRSTLARSPARYYVSSVDRAERGDSLSFKRPAIGTRIGPTGSSVQVPICKRAPERL
jgi:hypothetical protein